MASHLFGRWADVEPLVSEARAVRLYLDFDGTLAPIHARPELAAIGENTRRALERFARHPRARVTIISGRRRNDVMGRVGIAGAQYWGLFGWEQNERSALPRGGRAAVAEARSGLFPALRVLSGVQLEDKRFVLSVHLRRATQPVRRRVRELVRDCVARSGSRLYLMHGLEVWHVLPRQIRGKGHAIDRALRRLSERALPIYVGDDRTDEPAFAALRRGVTVHVGTSRRTHARYRLADTDEVGRFIERLQAVM
jgi:trehalose-phosphatase